MTEERYRIEIALKHLRRMFALRCVSIVLIKDTDSGEKLEVLELPKGTAK